MRFGMESLQWELQYAHSFDNRLLYRALSYTLFASLNDAEGMDIYLLLV
jgi:hypothetical protein